MIAELQAEKDRLDEAILALERLSARKLKQRGQAPPWRKSEIQPPSPHEEKTEETPKGH